MLIYTNINGEKEAVVKAMVVRFSRREDLALNCTEKITFIHLANREQLKSLDDMASLIKQMDKKNILKGEKNNACKEKQIE
ncbi:MAG: hypothetical protein ACHQJ4_01000 [Ignavibacteria bacterium]